MGNVSSKPSNTIVDSSGIADLSFKGIPLNAIKKALFNTKSQTVYSLVKMVVNGITYDINKTSKSGAVIFEDNYGTWEFVAPNEYFSFADYSNMTIKEVFDYMEEIITEKPIPAWDKFVEWVAAMFNTYPIDMSGFTGCVFTDVNGSNNYPINIINLNGLTNALSLLEAIEDACEPIWGNPLAPYVISEKEFGFTLTFVVTASDGVSENSLAMTFKFRE